jgi:hypothetical protein
VKPKITVPMHLSEAQYRELARDLAELQRRGATSKTAAIIDAVHSAVARPYTQKAPNQKNAGRRKRITPPARQQEVDS